MTDRLPPAPHLLVTGGAGFIGSELVRQVLARRDGTRVTVLDKLTYAGNRANLEAVETDDGTGRPVRLRAGGHRGPGGRRRAGRAGRCRGQRRGRDPRRPLDPRPGGVPAHGRDRRPRAARGGDTRGAQDGATIRFLQVSTDEVYGDIPEGRSRETDALAPRSPYAAAKAAGEHLVRAYHVTFGVDTVITRGSNTYGPHQHPEKLIPLFTTNALAGEPLPMYGDGMQVRDWLHVSDHASGIDFVLRNGEPGEAYNVAGGTELPNREVIGRLLEAAGRDWSLVRTVPDRPGHDRRYAMDGSKLAALGWRPRVPFERGLPETVAWYRDHPDWVASARSGDWDAYYERQYGARLAAGRAVDGAG